MNRSSNISMSPITIHTIDFKHTCCAFNFINFNISISNLPISKNHIFFIKIPWSWFYISNILIHITRCDRTLCIICTRKQMIIAYINISILNFYCPKHIFRLPIFISSKVSFHVNYLSSWCKCCLYISVFMRQIFHYFLDAFCN